MNLVQVYNIWPSKNVIHIIFWDKGSTYYKIHSFSASPTPPIKTYTQNIRGHVWTCPRMALAEPDIQSSAWNKSGHVILINSRILLHSKNDRPYSTLHRLWACPCPTSYSSPAVGTSVFHVLLSLVGVRRLAVDVANGGEVNSRRGQSGLMVAAARWKRHGAASIGAIVVRHCPRHFVSASAMICLKRRSRASSLTWRCHRSWRMVRAAAHRWSLDHPRPWLRASPAYSPNNWPSASQLLSFTIPVSCHYGDSNSRPSTTRYSVLTT